MLEDEQFVQADVFLDPPGCGLESDEDGKWRMGVMLIILVDQRFLLQHSFISIMVTTL